MRIPAACLMLHRSMQLTDCLSPGSGQQTQPQVLSPWCKRRPSTWKFCADLCASDCPCRVEFSKLTRHRSTMSEALCLVEAGLRSRWVGGPVAVSASVFVAPFFPRPVEVLLVWVVPRQGADRRGWLRGFAACPGVCRDGCGFFRIPDLADGPLLMAWSLAL